MTAPGELIAARYRLEAAIGAGGGGAVWRARDEKLGRAVAIKLLQTGLEPSERSRFRREAQAMNARSRQCPECVPTG